MINIVLSIIAAAIAATGLVVHRRRIRALEIKAEDAGRDHAMLRDAVLAVTREMGTAVSIVRERTPSNTSAMEAARAVDRWRGELVASLRRDAKLEALRHMATRVDEEASQ